MDDSTLEPFDDWQKLTPAVIKLAVAAHRHLLVVDRLTGRSHIGRALHHKTSATATGLYLSSRAYELWIELDGTRDYIVIQVPEPRFNFSVGVPRLGL